MLAILILLRGKRFLYMKKYYTIYEIDKENNDIINTWESEKREDIANWLDIRLDNLSKYVAKNIDNITCNSKSAVSVLHNTSNTIKRQKHNMCITL